ncbi:MAG TPA: PIG-L family deacetylase [Thermoanaerobaculia bacterium]|nr:PIG-L family deacetylase [Thermoanaerobaculia bacterium]
MLIEAEAIPYDPAPLRGERLLVLAPHPDDEVIGCGGLLALHLREKRAVFIVVATDGTKATGASVDAGTYRQLREAESRRGLDALGEGAGVDFLRFPDRGLDDSVAAALRERLLQFRPDVVCLPSPMEIHPDHIALSRAFCLLIQRDESLFAELAMTRVAFYEISHPIRPNTLVDITDVAETKYAAIAAHQSQIELKDYVAYARGLNAYRAMTLPPATRFAEGYWVTALPELHRTSFGDLRRAVGAWAHAEIVRETIPVTVVVRTKDRPALLREALGSIAAGQYPAEVVVVNDGGSPPDPGDGVTVVDHGSPRGRSEAMNSGVRAARTRFIAFLDDDDLFYPEHLPALGAAVSAAPKRAAWYTDALSVFLRIGPSGSYERESRLRLFASDFDRALLLVDNYIPLPTLLVEREQYLAAGGFDAAFDLFEDWDFLIRLSQRGDFQRVPRITCEIRHFAGGGSIILDKPEGSSPFREAKLAVWRKHASLMSTGIFADVFERQKARLNELGSQLVDAKGRSSHLEIDIHRGEREQKRLVGELHDLGARLEERIRALEDSLQNAEAEAGRQAAEVGRRAAEVLGAQKELAGATSALRATYSEIERLQGLLDMIFKSRTWKLHTLLEKMRGRG